MGVNVNPGQMAQVQGVLRRLVVPAPWLAQLSMLISASGLKLVADEFRKETDPYGVKWAPLKRERARNRRARLRAMARGKKVKGQKILQDTGRMKGSVGAKPLNRQARIVIPTWYAAVHQNGAHIAPKGRLGSGYSIPARKMLPDGPLPDLWRQKFERDSRVILQRASGL